MSPQVWTVLDRHVGKRVSRIMREARNSKPDQRDRANILVQHLRREIFSKAEFGE